MSSIDMPTISVELSEYVKKPGGFAEVGRIIGSPGETIRAAIAAGRKIYLIVDPSTDQVVDTLELKRPWKVVAK